MDAALALKNCEESPFEMAEALLSTTVMRLTSKKVMEKMHSDVEEDIAESMRELARLLMQGHLDARGDGGVGKAVRGADRVERPHKRETEKTIRSIFGEVIDKRLGYSSPDVETLFPKDASLNLPDDSYSHGIHKRIAKEVAHGSFDEAIVSVSEATGVEVPKRQALKIVKTAACDFLGFYKTRTTEATASTLEPLPIMVITTDGKGVVMRKEGLREATKKKALKAVHKLDKRLSKGEKKNAKRMAQVAATYCIDRFIRKPEDIVREFNRVEENGKKTPRPKPVGKRVWASLEMSQKEVIRDLFCEALKRDPEKKKSWVALVDGQGMQLESIEAEAKKHDVPVTIILDIIHVTEYLWKASTAFYGEGALEREWWVNQRLLSVLRGKVMDVSVEIRDSATVRALTEEQRVGVDKCVDYLQNNAAYLKYDEYLALGYPIATGIIEGACRHLVKDRMDITGARWSLDGGEAVLKLRSLVKSGDFEEYWAFHLGEEYKRNHAKKYAEPERLKYKGLKIMKKPS